jgi:hypothetical protein
VLSLRITFEAPQKLRLSKAKSESMCQADESLTESCFVMLLSIDSLGCIEGHWVAQKAGLGWACQDRRRILLISAML